MNINDYIPQAEPFKFLDEVIEHNENSIVTTVKMKETFDFYRGHFPSNPIIPGVILCEACFQAGAMLMALRSGGKNDKTTVVTRIQNAKFKNISKPNDQVTIKVSLKEEIANAVFFSAKAYNQENKVLVAIDFAAAAVEA